MFVCFVSVCMSVCLCMAVCVCFCFCVYAQPRVGGMCASVRVCICAHVRVARAHVGACASSSIMCLPVRFEVWDKTPCKENDWMLCRRIKKTTWCLSHGKVSLLPLLRGGVY